MAEKCSLIAKIGVVGACGLLVAASGVAQRKTSVADLLSAVSQQNEKPVFVVIKDEKLLAHTVQIGPTETITQVGSAEKMVKRFIEKDGVAYNSLGVAFYSSKDREQPEVKINQQLIDNLNKTSSLKQFLESIDADKRNESMSFDCQNLSESQKKALCTAFGMNASHLQRGTVRLDFRSWASFVSSDNKGVGLPMVQMNGEKP